MAGQWLRNRRRELQASGLAYQQAHEQATREYRERPDPRKEVAPPAVWNSRAATKHGARSGHAVTEAMEAFTAVVTADATCGYIVHSPGFAPQLQRWAMAEAKVALYATWLDKQETVDDKCKYAESQMAYWMRHAERSAEALGLTPASRARIGSDLKSVLDAQRPVREDAEIEELVGTLTGGGDVLSSFDQIMNADGKLQQDGDWS